MLFHCIFDPSHFYTYSCILLTFIDKDIFCDTAAILIKLRQKLTHTVFIQFSHTVPEFSLLNLFFEGLVYDDERQHRGKALLGETGDVTHEKAEVECDKDEENDEDPEANPKPKSQVVPIKLPCKQNQTSC